MILFLVSVEKSAFLELGPSLSLFLGLQFCFFFTEKSITFSYIINKQKL